MHIVDASWTRTVNALSILCRCGRLIMHRADRWTVRCPKCGATENLARLRERWVAEQRTL